MSDEYYKVWVKRRSEWSCIAILGHVVPTTLIEAELSALSALQAKTVTGARITGTTFDDVVKEYTRRDRGLVDEARRKNDRRIRLARIRSSPVFKAVDDHLHPEGE